MAGIPIAVDIMGGDYAPEAIIQGAAAALDSFGDAYYLFLVGKPELITDSLRSIGKLDHPQLEIVEAPDHIAMGDHPINAVRNKPKASINVAVDLVKKKRARGVFSAGNTGAAVGSSYLKMHMLPGLERPCIATVLPHEHGNFVLLDAGATVDCSAHNLAQFAVMGDIYARTVLKRKEPRVGILSNGTEVGKGNYLTTEAFKLLRDVESMNFIGNVEGHHLFAGEVDVVVCDGFLGNVVLKCSEQIAKSMGQMLKQQLMKKLFWKLGALLSRGAFKEFKQRLDPTEVGGAPLLGVNGTCVIGHGNSNPKAVKNGIHAVGELISQDVNDAIVEQIHHYGLDNLLGTR
ncbi:MAG: phosphate acyltransferase PlsX [Oligosphaeraceae bacterium]|nr:phosphate acyltransferase PlsX [Oligosphaeraceae bacterium]